MDEPGSLSEGAVVVTWNPDINAFSVAARLGGLKLPSPSLSLATVLIEAWPALRAAARCIKAVPAETERRGVPPFSS